MLGMMQDARCHPCCLFDGPRKLPGRCRPSFGANSATVTDAPIFTWQRHSEQRLVSLESSSRHSVLVTFLYAGYCIIGDACNPFRTGLVPSESSLSFTSPGVPMQGAQGISTSRLALRQNGWQTLLCAALEHQRRKLKTRCGLGSLQISIAILNCSTQAFY